MKGMKYLKYSRIRRGKNQIHYIQTKVGLKYCRVWEHRHQESVSTVLFRYYFAGYCSQTTGRERRACHWSDCRVLGVQRRACDLQASWDWSKHSWTPFHWTSLHGSGPGKNRISVTAHLLWYAERVQAGREVSVQLCGQASHLTPGSDRMMSGE